MEIADTLPWLLDADPAIRWQALRDLTDTAPELLAQERSRVARDGLGAAILAAQQPNGAWYSEGEPLWLSTLFSLQLLRATGADPASPEIASAIECLATQLNFSDYDGCWELRPHEFGGNPFFEGEEEPCINGGVLALGGYFGHPSENLARRLLSEQLADGGWNCEAPKSVRSSFNTTICVLEGLLEYERAVGSAPEVAAARHRAEEFLLARGLFRRLSTGLTASAEFLELAFPPRYHYNILRALEYFRASGGEPERRMREAIDLIESKRQLDGRWLLDCAYDEALPVTSGEVAGKPSHWITLSAQRVLRWYGRTA